MTLAPDGRVLVQTTEVAMDELVARLQAVASERDSTRIFLRADGAIPYERVMTRHGRAERRRFPRDRSGDG